MFTSFYEQLTNTKEYHQKYPNIKVEHGPELAKLLGMYLSID
jgi:hypothetical protein